MEHVLEGDSGAGAPGLFESRPVAFPGGAPVGRRGGALKNTYFTSGAVGDQEVAVGALGGGADHADPREVMADSKGRHRSQHITSSSSSEPGGLPMARNMMVALLSRAAQYTVAIPLSILTARLLGPHDKGIYTVYTLICVLFTYCTLGASSAAIYAVGRRKVSLRRAVGNVAGLGLALAVVSTSVYLFLAFGLRLPVLVAMAPQYRIMIAVFGPMIILNYVLSDCQLAAHDITGYNVSTIVQVAIQVLGLGAFLLLFRSALMAATLAYGVSLMASLACSVVLLWRFTAIIPQWDSNVLGGFLRFGLQNYVASIFNFGNSRLDSFLVAAFVGVTAVGYYAVSVGISGILWQLPLVIATVLFPASAAVSAERGARLAAATCRRSLFVVVCFGVVVVAVSRFLIVGLYGAAYIPALLPLYILLPGALGFTTYKTLYSYLLGNDRGAVGMLSTGVSLAVTITLDLFLIPRYGIEGAAAASSIAYCTNGAIVLVGFARYSGTPLRQILFLLPVDLHDARDGARGALDRLAPLLSNGNDWLKKTLHRWRGPAIWFLTGAAVGLWLAVIVFNLSATLFVLTFLVGMIVLGVFDRLWLVAALVVADLTLTGDSTASLAQAQQSIHLALGLLTAYASALALAQGRFALGRLGRSLALVAVAFLAIALLGSVLNGGEIGTFLRHTGTGFLLLFTVAGVTDRMRRIAVVIGPILAIALLSGLTTIAQFSFHSSVGVGVASALAKYPTRPFGLAQTPVDLANTLAVSAALLAGLIAYGKLSPWLRILGGGATAVLVVGVYLSGTRSGLISLGVAALVLALGLPKRWRIIALLGLLIGGSGLAVTYASGKSASAITSRTSGDLDISSSQREALWLAGALIIRDHPIIGIGYDQFTAISPQYESEIVAMGTLPRGSLSAIGTLPPHNDFLMIWISFGGFGFLAYVLFFALGFWRAWKSWQRSADIWIRALSISLLASLAAYCAYSVVHNAFEGSLVLWLLLGLVAATEKLSRATPQ